MGTPELHASAVRHGREPQRGYRRAPRLERPRRAWPRCVALAARARAQGGVFRAREARLSTLQHPAATPHCYVAGHRLWRWRSEGRRNSLHDNGPPCGISRPSTSISSQKDSVAVCDSNIFSDLAHFQRLEQGVAGALGAGIHRDADIAGRGRHSESVRDGWRGGAFVAFAAKIAGQEGSDIVVVFNNKTSLNCRLGRRPYVMRTFIHCPLGARDMRLRTSKHDPSPVYTRRFRQSLEETRDRQARGQDAGTSLIKLEGVWGRGGVRLFLAKILIRNGGQHCCTIYKMGSSCCAGVIAGTSCGADRQIDPAQRRDRGGECGRSARRCYENHRRSGHRRVAVFAGCHWC